MDTIKFHPKQGQAFETKNKVTVCCSGIQGGKTTVGAMWALNQSIDWGADSCGIIGAPTYKVLNQSTLPTFLKWAGRFGVYHKADQEFHFQNGFKVYIRTSTDPDSIEGIQNVRWIWLDEAGKCKYQFWINAEGRGARTNAPLFLTTTPYGLNWLYKQLLQPYKAGDRPDVSYYEWLSIDNPSFPIEEYERQKRILDPRVFRMKYMGIHERMEGLVYQLTEENYCEQKTLPAHTRFFGGVDFGFADGHEFACVIRGITHDGFRYEVDEFKGAGLEPSKQVMLLKAKQQTYGVETFYCDPARPDMIAELNKAGVRAHAFHIGKTNYKQVISGINKHIELIRSGRYQIFRGRCPQLEDEYETYHWPEAQEGKLVQENPVPINDHLMDAARYCSVGSMNINVKEPKLEVLSMRRPEIDGFDPTRKSRAAKNWNSY